MYDDVIKFRGRECDLDPTPEYWQENSYDERYQAILAAIMEVRGYLPSKRMQPIREGVFKVQDSTTIDEVVTIAKELKRPYKIDCFQVSIDRRNNTAHLLFDWNKRETGDSFFLNRSQQIAMSVKILRFLKLPRPKGTELWRRQFLVGEYEDNPEVFRSVLGNLKHAKLGKRSYRIVNDALTYMQQKCEGLVK